MYILKYLFIIAFVFAGSIFSQENSFDTFDQYRKDYKDINIMQEIFPAPNSSYIVDVCSSKNENDGKTYVELNAFNDRVWMGEVVETERYFEPIKTPHIFYGYVNEKLDILLIQKLDLGFSSRAFVINEIYLLDKVNSRIRSVKSMGNVVQICPYKEGVLIYQQAGGIYGIRLHKIYTYVRLNDDQTSTTTDIIDTEIPFEEDLKK